MAPRARFGTIVYEALNKLHGDDVLGGHYVYRTAAQIAAIGEVSIPTARKYLNELVLLGEAKTMQWGRFTVYGTTKDMYERSDLS